MGEAVSSVSSFSWCTCIKLVVGIFPFVSVLCCWEVASEEIILCGVERR